MRLKHHAPASPDRRELSRNPKAKNKVDEGLREFPENEWSVGNNQLKVPTLRGNSAQVVACLGRELAKSAGAVIDYQDRRWLSKGGKVAGL